MASVPTDDIWTIIAACFEILDARSKVKAYKLEHLSKLKDLLKKNYIIEVDGGINDLTIIDVKDYVDLAVCGSFICCSDNYEEKIKLLFN